jgi:uncharacterized protein YehS (DUF1456 family)
MNNNDILRRLRYTFAYSDSKMISIFALVNHKVSRDQNSSWLKKDDDPDYKECKDKQMASFLNGLIIEKRGKKDGKIPVPEERLTNNIIFTKLKIALNLKAEDVLEIMDLAEFKISKHELSAFFRKPGNRHYRVCQDQILRNFLKGMQIKYRQDGSKVGSREENQTESSEDDSDEKDEIKVKPVKFKYNYKKKE